VLEELKIISSVTLTEKVEERNLEESDKDESFNADRDKLLAESKALAKPRILRPPVEKPKRRRGSASPYISEVDRFLDPFCERTLAVEDLETLSTSLTPFLPITSSIMSSPVSFAQPMYVHTI
jgi:hypothetical protein